MVYVPLVEEQSLVEDVMVRRLALYVKEEAVLLRLDMEDTFHVRLVIRRENVKSVKVQGSVCVLAGISQDIYQGQTLFMGLMEELFLLIALLVVEVPLQVLPHHQDHAHHPLAVHVVDVVGQA